MANETGAFFFLINGKRLDSPCVWVDSAPRQLTDASICTHALEHTLVPSGSIYYRQISNKGKILYNGIPGPFTLRKIMDRLKAFRGNKLE